MKKIVVMLTLMLVAVVANAASVKWNAANLFGSDGVTKFTGDVVLHCVEYTDFSATAKATSGAVALTTTALPDAAAGTTVNFYITFVDQGHEFQTANKAVAITSSPTTPAQSYFGNMQSQTQTWAQNLPAGDPTPEPTSGLLLLVGGAMLALRRKQK